MKTIIIERKELTTYSVVLEIEDDEAYWEWDEQKVTRLCKASNGNWQDAEKPEFEVYEFKD